ncbi:MazG nucleotide pyrophosphohydrolase domain-containing protein [Streptomyces sp. NPDC001185]|uniref:MazG nucleotide pyrophosphohydrolase domain-containing protein n=1 Tax=Streptomyces sp. NPDC001185 TaxID=3154380 RepID=UPI00332717A8
MQSSSSAPVPDPASVPSAASAASAASGEAPDPETPAGPGGSSDGSPSVTPSPAALVRAFHLAFGLDTRSTPGEVSPALAAHRGELLAEEAAEVAEVSVTGPLDRLAHELADLVYVAYGTALVHGIDLDEVIAEIHRSNMTKLGPDGRVARRADGKVLKGEHYRMPDVTAVLRGQGWRGAGA